MKKRLYLILLIVLFIISGCSNKKEEIKEQTTNKVNTTIADITNISEEQIKESYNYIKDNYTNFKKEKTYEKLLYHIKYLQQLGKYSKDNDLTKLANNTLKYIEKNNSKNKKEVLKLLSIIDGDEEELIKEIYDNYLKLKVIKEIIQEQTPIASGDANDQNMITKKNINKAIDYLNKHSQNPFKNDEVLEKTIYYSLYLSELGNKDNEITQMSQHMIKYLSTFDQTEKDKANQLLNTITKKQSSKVETYYNEINKRN